VAVDCERAAQDVSARPRGRNASRAKQLTDRCDVGRVELDPSLARRRSARLEDLKQLLRVLLALREGDLGACERARG